MRSHTRRAGVALAVGLLIVAGSGIATAHGGDDGFHHHDGPMGTHGGMGGWMGWGLWFLWPILALSLAGVGVYLIVTNIRETGTSNNRRGDDALTVLRERYARGEIDDEEFEQRRRQLQADNS